MISFKVVWIFKAYLLSFFLKERKEVKSSFFLLKFQTKKTESEQIVFMLDPFIWAVDLSQRFSFLTCF